MMWDMRSFLQKKNIKSSVWTWENGIQLESLKRTMFYAHVNTESQQTFLIKGDIFLCRPRVLRPIIIYYCLILQRRSGAHPGYARRRISVGPESNDPGPTLTRRPEFAGSTCELLSSSFINHKRSDFQLGLLSGCNGDQFQIVSLNGWYCHGDIHLGSTNSPTTPPYPAKARHTQSAALVCVPLTASSW